MKKKGFHLKLKLGKKVISNLQASTINGGDFPIPVATTLITIKTRLLLCTHIATCDASTNCNTKDECTTN